MIRTPFGRDPTTILWLMTLLATPGLRAQGTPSSVAAKTGGSANVRLISHIRMGGYFRVGGVELEQELSRPYAYVARMFQHSGFSVVSLADPASPKVLYTWHIDRPENHKDGGGETGKYFKTRGRYYYTKAFEFGAGTEDQDLATILWDVTGLPDVSKIKEAGRIRAPESSDGAVNVFPYKHSDGRVLLFVTLRYFPANSPPHANIYDMDKFLAGDANQGLLGRVPVPETDFKSVRRGYHDAYVAYDPATRQDKFYGAGPGGFYVFDLTKPEEPKLLTSLTGLAGTMSRPHTIIPSPDGRYAVTQMESQFSPLMIWDLKPGLDKQVPTITAPISVWTADLRDVSHNHEMRWPFVFAAAYEDGLQIFDISNPKDPRTVGWYYTCQCAHEAGYENLQRPHANSVFNGAFELDVRNADGLIVLSDLNTGLWTFRLDGFDGWDGREHDMPNASSVQEWDRQ